jgi:hypothetical protein
MATSSRYEGSPEDKRKDKKAAKAAGMSLKAWEKSPQDKAIDRKGQALMTKRREGARKR